MGSATAWARRTYSGTAPQAELDSGITAASLSITVDNGAGFPSTGPFFITIDRGTASEEKVEVASRSSDTFTVTSTTQRGVDGTSAVSHLAGATVEHTITATDVDEANAASAYTVGKVTTKGDLVVGTGSKQMDRLAAGTDGLPLVADSGEATGLGYAALAAGGLASNAVETAKIADEAVTGAKIEDAQRRMPGEVKMTAYSDADTGWLLCDGSAVSRTTYSDLFSAIGTSFGTGDGSTTFNLPNFENAFPVGAGDDYSVGATGGSATHTLTDGELPGHVHSVSLTTGNQSANHTHGAGTYQTSTAGSHDHNYSSGEFVGTAATGIEGYIPTSDPGSTQTVRFANAVDDAGSHSHTVSGTSAANSVDHTHTVSGNTGNGPGSADAFSTLPPYLAIHFQIKT